METTADRIEFLLKRFRNHLARIDRLKVQESTGQQAYFEGMYKKVIYVALLDALSRAVYPNKRTNRRNLIRFLENFCEWPDCDRVSFPHLTRLLQLRPQPDYQRLREFAVSENATKWQPFGKPVYLTADPTFGEIRNLWPNPKDSKEGDGKMVSDEIHLEDLQHTNLFYQYRNSLVHGLKPMEDGPIPFDEIEEPYYVHSAVLGDSWEKIADSWDLVYPLSFFRRICTTAVGNLEKYLQANRLDPFGNVAYTTYWLDQLN